MVALKRDRLRVDLIMFWVSFHVDVSFLSGEAKVVKGYKLHNSRGMWGGAWGGWIIPGRQSVSGRHNLRWEEWDQIFQYQ